MWRVLVADRAWPETEIEQEILARYGAELIDAPSADEATLVSLVADVHAIATNWGNISAAVINAAPQLRTIARTGIGVDNIDLAAATARGIPVTNCPDYCVEEVADHALALLLAFSRKIAFFHRQTKQGHYDLLAAGPLQRLSTQTLGLFGLGRTAQAFASRAKALGLKLIAHTQSNRDYGTGIEMVSADDLFRRSDFLSLHAPLTPQTRHTINGATLAQMKPTAVILNTSRGGLIDERALASALSENRIGGAGLDVFDPEPPDLSTALFQDERVIATPHVAFASVQSVQHVRRQAMEQIGQVLTDQTPLNVVNPQFAHNRS